MIKNMLKSVYKKIVMASVILSSSGFVLQNALADYVAPQNVSPPVRTMTQLIGFIFTLAHWFELIVIAIGVIFLIMGGFTYITAGGSEDSVKSAKNYLTYGILGIVIALSAEAIIRAIAFIFGVSP